MSLFCESVTLFYLHVDVCNLYIYFVFMCVCVCVCFVGFLSLGSCLMMHLVDESPSLPGFRGAGNGGDKE